MARLSLSKFVKYLRSSPRNAIRFNLVKYAMIPTLNRISSKGRFLGNQIVLLEKLFQKDNFTLVILDACRYDLFSKIYNKYFDGRLIKVRSVGSNTYEWLPKVFPLLKSRQVTIFSAHPAISSIGVEYRGFRAIDYILRENIVDVWKDGWNEELNTVLPWEVNKMVLKRGLSDRNIIWYVQPHFPWISLKEDSKKLAKECSEREIPFEELALEKVRKGELSRKTVIRGYLSNLHLVLLSIKKLFEEVRNVRGQIVVTSDHGELLGEYGLYGHYPSLYLFELITVPWLIIPKNSLRLYETSPDDILTNILRKWEEQPACAPAHWNYTTEEEKDIKERLKRLGYL